MHLNTLHECMCNYILSTLKVKLPIQQFKLIENS